VIHSEANIFFFVCSLAITQVLEQEPVKHLINLLVISHSVLFKDDELTI